MTAALLAGPVPSQVCREWGRRFGEPVPWLAGELVRAVLVAVAADADPGVRLAEAAAGLGVLRARQGHDAAGLVEDLLALRGYLEPRLAEHGVAAARLSQALDAALRAGVGALVTELAEPAGRLPVTRDPLTGLLTRPVFEEALAHEVHAAARHGAPGLLVVDLDGLTRYMEVQGHLAGDLYLVRVAEILTGSARRSDVLGRLGVDQLGLVLPRTDLTRALVVARRVLARVLADARAGERADPGSTRALPVLSVGIGWLPAPAVPGELLAAAEQAVDRARRGGGRVVETNLPGTDG